jgi:hypothetical protein
MPEGHGYPNESEQERKQRIKKLKARTSKMRLAEVNSRRDITLGGKKYNLKEFEDHMASKDRPTYSGEIPGSADKLRKERATKPKKL